MGFIASAADRKDGHNGHIKKVPRAYCWGNGGRFYSYKCDLKITLKEGEII